MLVIRERNTKTLLSFVVREKGAKASHVICMVMTTALEQLDQCDRPGGPRVRGRSGGCSDDPRDAVS